MLKTQVLKALIVGALAALIVVPAASAGNGNGKAKPLPLDQALPLINGPAATGTSTTAPISKQDAVAAMTSAGAATTVAGEFGSAAAAVAASTGCAAVTSWVTWGTWPYDRTLYENTYWCAVYGNHITSYSTTVTTDQTLCQRSNTDSFPYSGGVGYAWVTVQANATWSCPIIGFIPYSVGGWLRTAYNAWGNSQIVDHS